VRDDDRPVEAQVRDEAFESATISRARYAATSIGWLDRLKPRRSGATA